MFFFLVLDVVSSHRWYLLALDVYFASQAVATGRRLLRRRRAASFQGHGAAQPGAGSVVRAGVSAAPREHPSARPVYQLAVALTPDGSSGGAPPLLGAVSRDTA